MYKLPISCQVVWQPAGAWRPLATGECHLWQLDLTRFPAQSAVLDAEEQIRWLSMTQPQAAQRFCATRTALRQLLGHYLCCNPADVAIRLGAQGKPELATTSQSLFFNLSHTADVALLAFCSVGPIGVDVERSRNLSGIRRVAERVFNADEVRCLREAGDDPQVFLRLWVRYEARQKCLGLGLLQKTLAPVTLDFFAGTWGDGWQLGLAWFSQPVKPELHFFQLH